MAMTHTEWYTQNAHTLYQTAVVWHAQSSGVRVKQLWPHFDEHLHMFMLTMPLSWKDMHGTWLYLLPIYYYVIGTIWGQVKQVSIKFNFLYHNFRWALNVATSILSFINILHLNFEVHSFSIIVKHYLKRIAYFLWQEMWYT